MSQHSPQRSPLQTPDSDAFGTAELTSAELSQVTGGDMPPPPQGLEGGPGAQTIGWMQGAVGLH
jgi:hypothetical protein